MPITIPPDAEMKRPTCPKCGSTMTSRSIVGDEREGSTEQTALICTNRECRHRTES